MLRSECLLLFNFNIFSKDKILSSSVFQQQNVFTQIEKDYRDFVKNGTEIEDPFLYVAHHTAEQIYTNYHPIGTEETSLYLLWFSAVMEMQTAGALFKNCIASAAAIDYLWSQSREKKKLSKKLLIIMDFLPLLYKNI